MPSDAVPDGLSGRVLAERYRVSERLGEGGAGVVFRAEHLTLGKAVAIKMLHDDALALPHAQKRFEREAHALAALSHPNVITITDFGREGTTSYLAMELVEGPALRDVLREGPMPRPRAFNVARQMLRALAYAHSRGVLHRDLKPANVMLQTLPDGELVKLLDFGMAKLVGDQPKAATATLTGSGYVVGTPAYIAPELLDATKASPSSDLYAVGVVLYEMLTGQKPFDGETAMEILHAHLTEDVPSLAGGGCSEVWGPRVDQLLARMLEKEVADRIQTAEEALDALDDLEDEIDPAGHYRSGFTRKRRRVSEDDATGAVGAADTLPAQQAALVPEAADPPPARRSRVWSGLAWLALMGGGVALGLWLVPQLAPSEPGVEVQTTHDAPVAPPNRATAKNATAMDDLSLVSSTEMESVDDTVVAVEPVEEVVAEVVEEVPTTPELAEMELSPPEAPAAEPEAEETAADDSEEVLVVTPAETAPEAPTEADPEAPTDLLAAGVSRRLAQLRRRARWARRPAQFTPLYDYARQHPTDARIHLILAHAFVRLSWRADAITRYQQAFSVDPRARGDARMMRDLVDFATDGSHTRRAAEAIAEIFGPEARDAVREAASAATDDQAVRRLRRLARRLR